MTLEIMMTVYLPSSRVQIFLTTPFWEQRGCCSLFENADTERISLGIMLHSTGLRAYPRVNAKAKVHGNNLISHICRSTGGPISIKLKEPRQFLTMTLCGEVP